MAINTGASTLSAKDKENYPFLKRSLGFIGFLVILMGIVMATIWFMKFTTYKPAKVSAVTIENETEEGEINLSIDFPKLSALQKEYFSIREPEKFNPQNSFRIYDTQLLTSLQDKSIEMVAIDKLIEKPLLETILLDDQGNPITNTTTANSSLTWDALREKLKKERELKEKLNALRK